MNLVKRAIVATSFLVATAITTSALGQDFKKPQDLNQPLTIRGADGSLQTVDDYCVDDFTIPSGLYWHGPLWDCYGRWVGAMQDDGNFVVYDMTRGGIPVAASSTYGTDAFWAVNQTDGNFVLYGVGGDAVYYSNTWGQVTDVKMGMNGLFIYQYYPYPPEVLLWQLPHL